MRSYDPLDVIFGALERQDCSPRGPIHKFIARCPVHEDDTPSLSVCEGVDGRAVVTCFAGCLTKDVLAALGLRWRDMFPTGHRFAPRARQPKVVTERPIVSVLAALNIGGIGYRNTASVRTFVADKCPRCGAGALWVHDARDVVQLSCWSAGCKSADILVSLEKLVTGEVSW